MSSHQHHRMRTTNLDEDVATKLQTQARRSDAPPGLTQDNR
jgi:hypothetical protein